MHRQNEVLGILGEDTDDEGIEEDDDERGEHGEEFGELATKADGTAEGRRSMSRSRSGSRGRARPRVEWRTPRYMKANTAAKVRVHELEKMLSERDPDGLRRASIGEYVLTSDRLVY